MVQFLLLAVLIPCALAKSTISTDRLFVNTLKRWNVQVRDNADKAERWRRFAGAQDAVDRTTRNVMLESLNKFSVMNDKEYEEIVMPLKRRSLNVTAEEIMLQMRGEEEAVKKLEKRSDDLPESYDYWENVVGLTDAADQLSCGSCWAFPDVGAIEALYTEQTGEMAYFSQQYFVDCTFEGDGCGGGGVADGFKSTQMRQYIPYASDYEYTAEYTGCSWGDSIASFEKNGFSKLWFTSYIPLSTTETGLLSGLEYSPVAFGCYISGDFVHYSGGDFEDSNCESDATSHAMLLVGYTETTLRIKNSYGTDWGENGFINLVRGADFLSECSYYKTSYAATAAPRREMEYAFCNNKKLGTYGTCKSSCDEMNTNSETGWTLAVIPTKYHNTMLVDMINSIWSGVKANDKFNYLWIGLTDITKSGDYAWVDGFTEFQYQNITENIGKYGMINKNTGNWAFKNSLSYSARGLCSRPTTCWDISTILEDGDIEYSDDSRAEGTLAYVKCDDGYSVSGSDVFVCLGGEWQADLDELSCI